MSIKFLQLLNTVLKGHVSNCLSKWTPIPAIIPISSKGERKHYYVQ